MSETTGADSAQPPLDNEQRLSALETGQFRLAERQASLERGLQGLNTQMAALSAEGRVRGEHAAQQSERQSREIKQTLTDFKAELTDSLRVEFKPLTEASDDLTTIKGGVKALKIIFSVIAVIVTLAGGWSMFMNWSGHALIMLSSHPQ